MRSLNLSQTFTAIRSPNFRLWFIGQVISLVGTWMQSTAQGYLIYELTKSSAYLGYVSFANGLPTLFLMLFGGLVSDRISRHKVVTIAQYSMMVLAVVLAVLTFTGWVEPWHIIILAFLLGIVNAFDMPARQAFVSDMVKREDLSNAIALNATIFNLGVVIGPAIGGLIYAWVGPAWCFTVNAISFIAVLIALGMMKIDPQPVTHPKGSPLTELGEGLKFAFKEPRIKLILGYVSVLAAFCFGLLTLLPAWSVEILGGDVRTNGLLLSFRGIGSLIGALLVAYIGSRRDRSKVWLAGWYVLPFALLGFGLVRWIPGSLALIMVIGWCMMAILNTSNAMIQSYVPDHLRGRVMSIYTLVHMGLLTLGSLMSGSLASKIGEPMMVYIGAVVTFAATVATLFVRKTIRQF